MKVFVAGMSGTGKSTVAGELKRKGFTTIDIDHVANLCSWVDKDTREKVDASNIESVDDAFMEQHDYECDVSILKKMVEELPGLVFVFGNVGDNSTLLPLFDKVFLLQCLPETLLERLKTRDTNSFGKDETVHQRVLDWCKRFDKLMLEAGAISISTEDSLEIVTQKLINATKLNEMQADIVNHLREAFDPDAIILHGSRARGKERTNSDWDIILLYDSKTDVSNGRELYQDQNIEYSMHVLPVDDIYNEFGAKLQKAKVLFEKENEGSSLVERAAVYYKGGVHWPDSKLEGHKLWAQGRIDGMKDTTDNPIIFDKYFRDFTGRVFNYWYWILQNEHSQPIYVAVDDLKERDAEYFGLVSSLFTETDLERKIQTVEAIFHKLFHRAATKI